MLPTQLRAAGIPIEEITVLTSLLVLPWAFKFLWAPLVDSLQTQRWPLRSWIIASQLMMGIALLPLLLFDLSSHISLITFSLLLHTLSAATQDVAIDALCIANVSQQEHGSINGWMQVGMLAGRSLFGGVALIIAQYTGFTLMIGMLISVIWGVSVFLLFVKIPSSLLMQTVTARFAVVKESLSLIVKKRSTWFGLLFAVVGGAAYEGTGAVAGPFLIDRGFSLQSVGVFFSLPSVLSMMIGALLGGYLSDRIGKQRSVVASTTLIAVIVITIGAVDMMLNVNASSGLFMLLALLYFGIGVFTASSYALFMNITDAKLGATQFSAFMGGTNLCESWSALAIGELIAGYDYPMGFFVMGCVSLLALLVVKRIK